MAEWKKIIEVRDKEFTVYIDTDGTFYSDHDGERVESDSIESLTEKLQGRMKKKGVKLNIPAVFWDNGIVRGAIVGIHAGNNNLLFRRESTGRVEQLSYWKQDELLPSEQADTFEELSQALVDAQKALDQFTKKHAIKKRDLMFEELRKVGA